MIAEALRWHRFHAHEAQRCRLRADNCTDVIKQNEWDVDSFDHHETALLFLETMRVCIEAEAQAYLQSRDGRGILPALQSSGEDRAGNISVLDDRRHPLGASEV